MDSTTSAKKDTDTVVDFDAVVRDLAALRRDFADLLAQMKSGARNGLNNTAEDVLSQLGDQVNHLYKNATTQGRRSIGAVGRQVEEKPVMSLLIAFGVGFLASRLLFR